MKKVLVLSDEHYPYHDEKVIALVYKFAKYFKPDIIVEAGDLLDFMPISRFTKDPLDRHSLEEELELARNHLKKFRNLTKRMIFTEGNHEYRLQKYISDNARELALLTDGKKRVLTLSTLLALPEIKVKFVPMQGKESYVKLNDLLIGHFNIARIHSCYSAKAILERKGISLVTGHTHRLGTHYKTDLRGSLVAVENGCLCNLKPSYVRNPNWQHGFTVVYLSKGGHRFQAYNIPIVDYKFYFGNKLFEV